MPQLAQDLIGRPIGMNDVDVPEKRLKIIHAVDITDACGGNPQRRKLLKFTLSRRGVIVQFTECYEGQSNMGSGATYHVSDLGLKRHDMLMAFHYIAESFEISSERLLELVREHAPT